MRSKLSFIVKFSFVYLFCLVWANSGAQTIVVNNLLPADQHVCAPLSLGASSVIPPPVSSFSSIIPGFTPQTMTYLESSIPFEPGVPAGTVVNLTDDAPSGVLPIGFTFSFLGTTYTQFRISPNGFISLGTNTPTSLFSFDGDAMESDHCDPFIEYPSNAILGCYQDWNPNGVPNAIRYQTTGTAPNRILTVYYTNVPFYSTCPGTATFYIRLFETSNNVQIHIQNKPQCSGMWQDASFSGIAPPCNGSNCPTVSSFAGEDTVVNTTGTQYTFSSIPYTGTTGPVYENPTIEWEGLQGATLATATTSFNPTVSANGQTTLIYPPGTQNVRRYICKVIYESTEDCGVSVTLVDTFTFFRKPYDMAFTAVTPICLSETSLITYEGLTPVSPSSPLTVVAWNFGAGATPATSNSAADQTVSWNSTGIKTVTLSMSGGGCAPNDTSFTIEVVANPGSEFTFPAAVCAETAAAFAATVPIAGATYTWTTDGGIMVPATGGSNISIIWNTPGTKTVTLQVTVGSCVSSVTTHTVTVKPRPSAAFNPASPTICAESALQFTYLGTPAEVANYYWNFGSGVASPSVNAQNPSVIWNAGATVPVTFYTLGTNGCYSDTITQNIVVNLKPIAAISSPDSVCQNANLTLTCNLPQPAGSVYAWNFGSATLVSGNPSTAGPFVLSWPTAGNQDVELTVTSPQGCVSEDSIKVIEVNPIPSSDFTISMPSVCIGVNSILTHSGITGIAPQFQWTSIAGSVFSTPSAFSTQVNFSAQGISPINLRVIAEGCTSVVTTQNIEVLPTPSATFTATATVCQGDDAQLDYTGTGTNNALFNWSYSGGIPSTGAPGLAPFTVSWNSPGTKTVTLTVTEFGCSSLPFSQNVLVNAIPTAVFNSNSPSCAGLNDTLTYAGNASATASYSWTFNGATSPTATGVGPHYVSWANPGTYSVGLVVSENGCVSNTNQITVQVNPIPVADFTVSSPVCKFVESQITYTGTSGAAIQYTWDFNNGSVSPGIGEGPHAASWSTAGTKTIGLTVVSQGCISSLVTKNVEVLELPVADAGLDQWSCSGGTVDLGTPAIVGNTYQWSPSNGLTNPLDAQTQASFTNTTNGAVELTYILRVFDGQCINRDTVVYEIIQPVAVSFVPPAGQCFTNNSFDFEALGTFSPNANFTWDFGPNASVPTSNVADPSGITFATTGIQTISIQVEDDGCLSNMFTSAVFVYEVPNVDFTINSPEGCVPHKVFFTNLSNNAMNVDYEWYFGDGEEAIAISPSYVYTDAGDYDVTLYVRAENGCDTGLTLQNQIHIYPTPDPLFYMNRNNLIMASDTGSEMLRIWEAFAGYDSTHFLFSPSFADIEEDTLLVGAEHEVVFSQPGEYTISHYVQSEWGCTDSLLLYVTVRNELVLFIPSSFSPDGDGINDVFTVVGQDVQQFEMQVYNRWGEKIFHTYDVESGWDGRYNASKEALDYGTYYYVIRVCDSQYNWHEVDGYINIIP